MSNDVRDSLTTAVCAAGLIAGSKLVTSGFNIGAALSVDALLLGALAGAGEFAAEQVSASGTDTTRLARTASAAAAPAAYSYFVSGAGGMDLLTAAGAGAAGHMLAQRYQYGAFYM